MSARADVLAKVGRLGEVWRCTLPSDEIRAAEKLVAAGVLRVDWHAVTAGGYDYLKRYYDPHWTPPAITPLRLVK